MEMVSIIIARVCQVREMAVRRALCEQHGSVCTSGCRMELLRVCKPSNACVGISGDAEVFLARTSCDLLRLALHFVLVSGRVRTSILLEKQLWKDQDGLLK